MSQTKEGGKKLRQRQIEFYGSLEAYKAEMKRRASKGGKAHNKGGFKWMAENDPERLKEIGRTYGVGKSSKDAGA